MLALASGASLGLLWISHASSSAEMFELLLLTRRANPLLCLVLACSHTGRLPSSMGSFLPFFLLWPCSSLA